jgi:hypothetical protein
MIAVAQERMCSTRSRLRFWLGVRRSAGSSSAGIVEGLASGIMSNAHILT